MARLPQPGGDPNVWGEVLNGFLRVVHNADGTLKNGIIGNNQVTSLDQSKIINLTADLDAKANKSGAKFSRGVAVTDPAVTVVAVWRAQFPCRVKAVLGYRTGGFGATINSRKNGSDTHLAADLSLSTAGNWLDGGGVQNTDYAPGDSLEVVITAVAGTPANIAVQIDFETL